MTLDKYLIAVDGGGSKCRVALALQNGQILSEVTGGPANIETSIETAQKNILSTCNKAFEEANLSPKLINECYAVLGLAGSNMGNYASSLSKNLPFAKNTIVNDGVITLKGAMGSDDGCIGAIGTGSVFLGQKNGKITHRGGWGFNLGDDGSGAKLGIELLKQTIRCADGLFNPSPLSEKVLKKFNGSILNIITETRGFKPADYAQYAKDVVLAFQKQDENAIQIVQSEVNLIERSLHAVGFLSEKPFCLLGGLGCFYLPLLNSKFLDASRKPLGSPLDGAISLAIKLYN